MGMMTPVGNWLTVGEAGHLTGYIQEQIRRLARAGKVKTQKWGTVWMIDRASLLAYIENEGLGPQPKRKKTKP